MKPFEMTAASLSVCAGILAAVLAASALSGTSPRTEQALHKYRALSSGEVRRLQATFDRLETSPKDRATVQAIHDAVQQDQELDEQLQLFHAWWADADPDQRTELQNVPDEEWVGRVRQLMAESLQPTNFVVRIPGGRFNGYPVPLTQLEPFFQDVLPDDKLNVKEQSLLSGIADADRSLARALITRDHVAPDGSRRSSLPKNRKMDRLYDAIAEHLIPRLKWMERRERLMPVMDERVKGRICVETLQAIVDHFKADFLDRTSHSTRELLATFENLDPTQQRQLMSIDPTAAATILRARLAREDGGEANAILAGRLFRFEDWIRRLPDRPRGRGPDERRRRPPGNDRPNP